VLSVFVSGRRNLRNSLGKLMSVGLVSGVRHCDEYTMRKGWPEKAPSFQYNVWLLSFEPGPNPNMACDTRPGPCPRVGSGWGLRSRAWPVQISILRVINRRSSILGEGNSSPLPSPRLASQRYKFIPIRTAAGQNHWVAIRTVMATTTIVILLFFM
jgi:hypothetical protein